ncbi:MAG: hypothetical protein IJC59_02225 [Lachnospiraceae bacterium]|nr:hypothetical protein [Lachnospiraceae bacterium]
MKKEFRLVNQKVNRAASKVAFSLALAAMLVSLSACGRDTTENAPEDMVNDTTDGGEITDGDIPMVEEEIADNTTDENGYVSGNDVTDHAATDENTVGSIVDDAGTAVGDAVDDVGNAVGDVVEGAGNVVEDVGEGVRNATR